MQAELEATQKQIADLQAKAAAFQSGLIDKAAEEKAAQVERVKNDKRLAEEKSLLEMEIAHCQRMVEEGIKQQKEYQDRGQRVQQELSAFLISGKVAPRCEHCRDRFRPDCSDGGTCGACARDGK